MGVRLGLAHMKEGWVDADDVVSPVACLNASKHAARPARPPCGTADRRPAGAWEGHQGRHGDLSEGSTLAGAARGVQPPTVDSYPAASLAVASTWHVGFSNSRFLSKPHNRPQHKRSRVMEPSSFVLF